MRTVYIDTNILGCEEEWCSIVALCKSTSGLRLAISDWHLVELASGTDRQQAFRRADFIDSLKPLWMHGYFHIQQCEVKHFIWQGYYRVGVPEMSVFTEYLSEVLSTYLGPQTVIGLNARKWVKMMDDLSAMQSEKAEMLDALRTLQAASPHEKKKIERDVFLQWIMPRINDRDPDNASIGTPDKTRIAQFCYENRDELYGSCPAVAIEQQLSKIRSSDPKRRPKMSDAIDLLHGVLGLSYCDYYVSRDGFARQCAMYAKKALPALRTAEICQALGDLCVTNQQASIANAPALR